MPALLCADDTVRSGSQTMKIKRKYGGSFMKAVVLPIVV